MQNYDYHKLNRLREQIASYNIQCEEFDQIDTQISLVNKWVETSEEFYKRYKKLNYDFNFIFKELTSLEVRQEIIELLENYLRKNIIFLENLNEILNKVPQFAKSIQEYHELIDLKQRSEKHMQLYNNLNDTMNPEKMDLENLQKFILETHLLPSQNFNSSLAHSIIFK